MKDVEASAEQLVPEMDRLKKEYVDPSKEVPSLLPTKPSTKAEIAKTEIPWFTGARPKHLTRKSFIGKWVGKSWELLNNKPKKFVQATLSPDVWHRKFTQHRTMQFYDAHAHEPDFTKPYVYAPLHMQPEETTSPEVASS